ncbi:MAG: HAD family hydrolase, partial [Acinetobacter sp.]
MLFITDLDGTLLDSSKVISDANLTAIEHFVAAGGLFTIATGRTEDTCRLATDLLPINAPVILYNGAVIMDLKNNHVLYQKTLEARLFRPILQQIMSQFPDVCIELFAYGPLMLINPLAVMDPYITKEKQPFRYCELDSTPEFWLKIMLSASHERLTKVQAFLKNLYAKTLPACTMMFSSDYYFEILNESCSKGNCAKWLASWLSISMQEVAAIGDHLNDIDLLLCSGHSFSPANAHQSVKDIS